jgi:hypothetical protein
VSQERNELDGAVCQLLEQRYGTFTAARGLWQWAGGAERELPSAGSELWPTLWALSRTEDGEASASEVVREALYDTPSDPLLLDFLSNEGEQTAPEKIELTDLLLVHLVRLRPFGFPFDPLRAALRAWPPGDWRETFHALTPALDEAFSPQAREQLIVRCRQLSQLGPLIDRVQELRDELRALTEVERDKGAGPDPRVLTGLERLRELHEHVKPLDKTDSLVAKLERGFDRLDKRISFRSRPKVGPFAAGLTSLLVQLDANTDNPHVDVSEAADAIVMGLYATRSSDEPDPHDAPPEPDPMHYDGVPADAPSEGERIERGVADLGQVETHEESAE